MAINETKLSVPGTEYVTIFGTENTVSVSDQKALMRVTNAMLKSKTNFKEFAVIGFAMELTLYDTAASPTAVPTLTKIGANVGFGRDHNPRLVSTFPSLFRTNYTTGGQVYIPIKGGPTPNDINVTMYFDTVVQGLSATNTSLQLLLRDEG